MSNTGQRPHAVQSIPGIGNFSYDLNGNMTAGAGRNVTWNNFDMPVQISRTTATGGTVSSSFVYGAEHQRLRQDRSDGSKIIYAGTQEVEVSAAGLSTVKTYWPHGIGVEIDRPGAATTELNWVHHDRLGSPVAITDQNGALKEKLAYDAWGKRRSLDGSSIADSIVGVTDNKGFTGHEMLEALELVHMNGRVYDPLVGRFMSGDPLIQDPTNGQNYNRYSYVLNNPTNLTDPTGFATCTPTANDSTKCETTAKETTPDQKEKAEGINQSTTLTPVKSSSGGGTLGAAGTHVPSAKNSWATYSGNTNTEGHSSNYIGGLNPAAQLSAPHLEGLMTGEVGSVMDPAYNARNEGVELRENVLTVIDIATIVSPFVKGVRLLKGAFSGFKAAKAAVADGRFYSVAFETRLSAESYPGVTRYMHFKEANIALEDALASNPALTELGISVPKSATGSILGKSPEGWVWHHDTAPGVMQLVPKSQHPNIPGGIFWETLHPDGFGGFSIWGK